MNFSCSSLDFHLAAWNLSLSLLAISWRHAVKWLQMDQGRWCEQRWYLFDKKVGVGDWCKLWKPHIVWFIPTHKTKLVYEYLCSFICPFLLYTGLRKCILNAYTPPIIPSILVFHCTLNFEVCPTLTLLQIHTGCACFAIWDSSFILWVLYPFGNLHCIDIVFAVYENQHLVHSPQRLSYMYVYRYLASLKPFQIFWVISFTKAIFYVFSGGRC